VESFRKPLGNTSQIPKQKPQKMKSTVTPHDPVVLIFNGLGLPAPRFPAPFTAS
jgi:hypothetical protein